MKKKKVVNSEELALRIAKDNDYINKNIIQLIINQYNDLIQETILDDKIVKFPFGTLEITRRGVNTRYTGQTFTFKLSAILNKGIRNSLMEKELEKLKDQTNKNIDYLLDE